MTRLDAGTPVTGPYSSYTAEQLVALERMKDRAYALGIARAEFVNKVLFPNGDVSDDIVGVVDAVRAALVGILNTGDLTDPAQLDRAAVAARRTKEVAEHIAQGRFLFVVDVDRLPVVYFQCVVEHNPDLPAELDRDDRDALEARAWEIAEVQAHIEAVMAEATGAR
jgi:hypothetical protein